MTFSSSSNFNSEPDAPANGAPDTNYRTKFNEDNKVVNVKVNFSNPDSLDETTISMNDVITWNSKWLVGGTWPEWPTAPQEQPGYPCSSIGTLVPFADVTTESSTPNGNLTLETINNANMSRELLEKAPKVAVYTPPNKQPWDDAVTLALTYAEIPYDTLWDPEVLAGDIEKYDWLHLHHEDFTGQYGKFYRNYRNAQWYISQKIEYEAMAKKLGFAKVSEQKRAVAEVIRDYVNKGGFVFATVVHHSSL